LIESRDLKDPYYIINCEKLIEESFTLIFVKKIKLIFIILSFHTKMSSNNFERRIPNGMNGRLFSVSTASRNEVLPTVLAAPGYSFLLPLPAPFVSSNFHSANDYGFFLGHHQLLSHHYPPITPPTFESYPFPGYNFMHQQQHIHQAPFILPFGNMNLTTLSGQASRFGATEFSSGGMRGPFASTASSAFFPVQQRATMSATDTRNTELSSSDSNTNSILSRLEIQVNAPELLSDISVGFDTVNQKKRKRTSATEATEENNAKESKLEGEDSMCSICLDEPSIYEVASIDGCSHKFCFICIEKWADKENTCPLCRKRFNVISRVNKPPPNKKKKRIRHTKKVKNRNQRAGHRLFRDFLSTAAHSPNIRILPFGTHNTLGLSQIHEINPLSTEINRRSTSQREVSSPAAYGFEFDDLFRM